MPCPSEGTLADFVEEGLATDEERAIGKHMDACAECRATVALTTRLLLAEGKGEAAETERPVAFDTTTSHYVFLNVLGAGAMGIVYAAHDPRLDRKVAVKLLREEEAEPDLAVTAKRLLREAQTMAKLSHPNVVAVYDVGTVGDRLFLAMEFVDGLPLGEWLHVEPRSWRAILDVF